MQVRPGWDIPLNAVLVTLLSSTLLCLIIIGSNIAFSVIISIGQVGIVGSYIMGIGWFVDFILLTPSNRIA
jgi:choline transport protein